ncbi:MAG: T9SS type A sorting domain-containing protein [Saprospiraceae bacterium]|nr:T9SS type A sorting domain-containing protein [Saprospiraceae bacterium]
MKNNNILFCLILLVTSANAAFAQRTMSPGTTQQVEKLPTSLKNLLHRAGFDTQTSTAAQNRNELVLDSTKTFVDYTETDSTPIALTVFTYPDANTKVELVSAFAGQWYQIERATITADDQQRIVEALGEEYDNAGQQWINDSRLLVYPHGNSPDLLDSFVLYLWDTNVNDWVLYLNNSNVYDDQDLLLESYNTITLGSSFTIKETFFYDINGDNFLIDEVALIDGEVYPASRTNNLFVNHQVIEEIYSEYDGVSDYVFQNRTTYSYTNFGAIEEEFSYVWDLDSVDWKHKLAVVYDFDAQQRPDSKATTTFNDGGPNTYELTNFTYVEDENLATETIYLANADDPEWILDNKTYYYYIGTTTVKPVTRNSIDLDISPNPTTGRFFTALDIEAEIRVFNTSGKLLKTMVVQPGQQIDISSLPAGLYYLTAYKELDYYKGKVVKQ